MRPALITGLRAEVNSFLGSLVFLTRLPVGHLYRYDRELLSRSALYFPLTGALVGLCGGLLLFVAYPALSSSLSVLLAMALMVLLTGGLHEDGLADAADSLVGGNTPPLRLEIMQDSRIGSYGALALWFSLTAKFLLLNELLIHSRFFTLCALISANALGRLSAVALLHFCPYVKTAESKSSPFGNKLTLLQFGLALLYTAAILVAIFKIEALLCLLAAGIVTWIARLYFQEKIGGITGDCLGAANQGVELSCYLVLVLTLHLGVI